MSFYGEGGYVFQTTDSEKEKYFSSDRYIARYKEPISLLRRSIRPHNLCFYLRIVPNLL